MSSSIIEKDSPILEVTTTPSYSSFDRKKKALIIFIVTYVGFLGPVSGNIYIPILPILSEAFNVSISVINATVSVFMAVFAFAPILWASWADFGGRKTLYLISLLIFLIANILLTFLPANIVSLFILRIFQAFGASSVMSLGAGTIADVIEPKHRGKAISIFMLGPQLGPIIGPVLSIVSSDGNWRWSFGIISILSIIGYILILVMLPETLRYLVGTGEQYKSKWFVKPRFIQKKLVDNPLYPKPPKPSLKVYWKLLKFLPIALCSFNAGLLFASFYALSVTFTQVLKETYHFSNAERSISYLVPGISLIAGSLLSGYTSDKSRAQIEKKTTYIPEKRFSLQIFGLVISSGGLLGYGWGCHYNIHVSAIMIFTFISGFGMTWVFTTNTTYLTECSTGQPATNVAIGNMMRNAAAALSSGIINKLIKVMGFGWCFTGLALCNVLGIIIVIILIVKGPVYRQALENS